MTPGRAGHRPDRVLLVALLAVFAGFAVAYTRVTPIGASPDEFAHLNYIDGIAHHLRLPPAGQQERQQPPLYYLLGAVVAKLTGDPRAVRLVSVLLGMLTVVAIHATARRLWPARPYLAVGSAAVFALLPEAQYISGAVNDDSLAWLAGALVVLVGIVVLRSPVMTRRMALATGLVVALAVLSKETVWALAALLLVVTAVRHGPRLRAVQVAALLGPSLVFAGWWFARNAVQFGSPLPPLQALSSQRSVLDSFSQLRGYVAATALSLVGMYGNGSHFVPIAILGVRAVPSLVAGAAVAMVAGAAAVVTVRSWPRWDAVRRRIALAFGVVLLVAEAQSLLNSATFNLQPQARYLLVAAAAAGPIAAWTIAWRRAPSMSGARRVAIAALIGVALLLDVSGLLTAVHTAA